MVARSLCFRYSWTKNFTHPAKLSKIYQQEYVIDFHYRERESEIDKSNGKKYGEVTQQYKNSRDTGCPRR